MLWDTNEQEVLRWQLFGKKPGAEAEDSISQPKSGHGLSMLKNKTNQKSTDSSTSNLQWKRQRERGGLRRLKVIVICTP